MVVLSGLVACSARSTRALEHAQNTVDDRCEHGLSTDEVGDLPVALLRLARHHEEAGRVDWAMHYYRAADLRRDALGELLGDKAVAEVSAAVARLESKTGRLHSHGGGFLGEGGSQDYCPPAMHDVLPGLVQGRIPVEAGQEFFLVQPVQEEFHLPGLGITVGVVDLRFAPESVTLPIGVEHRLPLQAITQTGWALASSLSGREVSWVSSDPSVASVDSTGRITTLEAGSTVVMAQVREGVEAQMRITVGEAHLERVELGPATVPSGVVMEMTATGHLSDGTTHDLSDVVSWSSSDPEVLSWGYAIVISGKPGKTEIVATLGSVRSEASLEVTAADIVDISVETGAMVQGVGFDARAFATFPDGSRYEVTQTAAWYSDQLVILGDYGQFGASPEATTLYAAQGGAVGQAPLTSIPKEVPTISLDCGEGPLVLGGAPRQLTAYGEYGDGVRLKKVGYNLWSSSDPAVASVSNVPRPEQVLALAPGTTRLTLTGSTGPFCDLEVVHDKEAVARPKMEQESP